MILNFVKNTTLVWKNQVHLQVNLHHQDHSVQCHNSYHRCKKYSASYRFFNANYVYDNNSIQLFSFFLKTIKNFRVNILYTCLYLLCTHSDNSMLSVVLSNCLQLLSDSVVVRKYFQIDVFNIV